MTIRRQGAFSLLAGIIFAAGWWVFIDGYNMGTIVLQNPAVSGGSEQRCSVTAPCLIPLPPPLLSLCVLPRPMPPLAMPGCPSLAALCSMS